MKIAIIVPMAEEAEFYRNHFHSENKEMFGSTEFEHFSVNGNDVYLGLSGIGKVQAAMNLSSLLTSVDIDVIFMTGSAGALKEDVHQEDLVLPNAFAYYDEERMLQTLRWLKEHKKQVIIFTCQTREEQVMKEAGLVYHKIEL